MLLFYFSLISFFLVGFFRHERVLQRHREASDNDADDEREDVFDVGQVGEIHGDSGGDKVI